MRQLSPEVNKELKPCCDCCIPFAFQTYFLGIPVSFTIICIFCRHTIKARNKEKAIIKWNRK